LIAPNDDWPLVERWELLDDIRGAERGCLLVGPGGVGKSTAARLVAGTEVTPVVITGVEGLASIPFGALHLAEMSSADVVPPRADDDAVTQLQAWLGRLADHRVPVIIDDPAHLDPEGAALLAEHVRSGHPVTITHRPDQPPPAALLDASVAAGMTTVEITPFDPSMVALAVELAIGREPTSETTAQLAALSGGNPMLLREIVRDLSVRGMWIDVDGSAGLAADADPSARLGTLLGSRLPDDPDALACLELIAHAGTIARALATRVVTEERLSSLIGSGWITGGETLSIAHPLMRQFVAERLDPVSLRRRLTTTLDQVGPTEVLDATSRLQCLRWSFVVDRDVAPGELQWGRSEASRRFDSDLACLIADRLSRTDPNVDTTLELALVLAQAERYDEVVSVLRAGQLQAVTPTEVVDITRFLLRFTGPIARLRRLGDPPDGLEIDVAAWADDRLDTTAFTDLLAALDLLAVGSLEEACDRADAVRAAGIEGLGDADEITMVCSLYSGDEQRALDAFGRLEGRLLDVNYRHPKSVVIDAAASSLLMLDGRFEQAYEFDGHIADVARSTHDHERAREMTGHRGMTALFTGRIEASIEAFTRFRGYPSPPGSLRTLYTAGLAQSLALAGRLADAERMLAEADREADLVAPMMLSDFENMLAMTLVLLGHADAGEDRMRRALRVSIDNRVGRAELMALHGLTRMDRIQPEDVQRVADLPAQVIPGTPAFTGGVLAMADACHRRDAAAMADAAETFASTEFGIGAAEAYAAACRTATDRRSPDAVRWLGALDDQLARSPGLTGATVMVERGVDRLTERERQVAVLAAGELTNPQIAERLAISVRTVENNLHRTFTKLHVSSRSGIGPAMLP